MNLSDKVKIKIGNIEKEGKITAISKEMMIIGLSGSRADGIVISLEKPGEEPERYEIKVKDAKDRDLMYD